jgi:hypothetical protein
MKPLPATEALDRYFLEARARLLDVAAILDRIHRGGPALNDPRLDRIRQALGVLADGEGAKAERIQQIFSLPYDSAWQRPKPGERNGKAS